MNRLIPFLKDEEAATTIEYALIVALVSIVGVIATEMAGGQIVNSFSKVSSTLASSNR